MRTVPAVLAAALAATTAAAQDRDARSDFSWSEAMPSGARLVVHNFHGPVLVRRATGDRPEVRGVIERGRDGDVRFRVVRDGRDVVICAYDGDDSECTPDGLRRESSRRNRWSRDDRNASARLSVLLPAGVRVDARSDNGSVTVEDARADVNASSGNGRVRVTNSAGSVHASSGNGDVTVTDAGGPVDASSGNGAIDVSTAEGPVSASSGNGAIEVRMRSLREAGSMRLSSGNGSIVVWLPNNFGGEVSSDGHDRFESDFPITLEGGLRDRRVRGRIGSGGGSRVQLSTGNGHVELRKNP